MDCAGGLYSKTGIVHPTETIHKEKEFINSVRITFFVFFFVWIIKYKIGRVEQDPSHRQFCSSIILFVLHDSQHWCIIPHSDSCVGNYGLEMKKKKKKNSEAVERKINTILDFWWNNIIVSLNECLCVVSAAFWNKVVIHFSSFQFCTFWISRSFVLTGSRWWKL